VFAVSASDQLASSDISDVVNATQTERMRVVDFAKSWIESKAAVVSRYTLEGYTTALDRHVCPHIGRLYYDAVGHLEVQGMVNAWLAEKKADGSRYSQESLKDWLRVFRNMTQDAVVQLHLERDPALRISLGDEVVGEGEAGDDKLTIDESHALLQAMRKKRPGSFALLSTKQYTGQRFCHVSALDRKAGHAAHDAVPVQRRAEVGRRRSGDAEGADGARHRRDDRALLNGQARRKAGRDGGRSGQTFGAKSGDFGGDCSEKEKGRLDVPASKRPSSRGAGERARAVDSLLGKYQASTITVS
jgi:hypothetical protein